MLVDGPDLDQQVKAATGKAKIRLGIDAVGGEATERLASCLAPGGSVVNYGMMSGEACQLSSAHLIFRGIRLTGFWLASWFRKASKEEQMTLFGDLIGKIAAGKLKAPIARTFPVEKISDAVSGRQPGRARWQDSDRVPSLMQRWCLFSGSGRIEPVRFAATGPFALDGLANRIIRRDIALGRCRG